MKGDFSKEKFDHLRHFSRVLMQQGRLQLDADYNEQVDILLHHLRTLALDLIGPHGGRDKHLIEGGKDDFKNDFKLLQKRYYVDGIMYENDDGGLTYKKQAGPPRDSLEANKSYFVYLDVWERHVTALDDETIHEIALGVGDTTTRAQVMSQFRVMDKTPDNSDIAWPANEAQWKAWDSSNLEKWLTPLQPANRGLLMAQGRGEKPDTNPCVVAPQSRYRGLNNQLYRVEIHTGTTGEPHKPTFKWSRDNGSIAFAVQMLSGRVATLAGFARGDRAGLSAGDWVELVEDDTALVDAAGPLAKVAKVTPDEQSVTLEPVIPDQWPDYEAEDCAAKHVQLRRWDYGEKASGREGAPKLAADGALEIVEGKWLTLEDGVQIWFAPEPKPTYRSGDYWLIPARTATGDVEWPKGANGVKRLLDPRGVTHHYVPVAAIFVNPDGQVDIKREFTRQFDQLAD